MADVREAADPRPVIGITCDIEDARWGVFERRAALLPEVYIDAVVEAGGRPLLVPPMTEAAAETVQVLDGLLLSGGPDIEPARYGHDRHPTTVYIRPGRDAAELALMVEAERSELPVLGLCRGVELLVVSRGGTLHQHVPDLHSASGVTVAHRGRPGHYVRHDVTVVDGSLLASIVGTRVDVPSYHHQAPAEPGEGLVPVAHAPDGIVEAVEDPHHDFVLGVLWHPEYDGELPLFEALVAAARRYRKGRR
ncbi:MAG: gamma-glutamyl-gamma-aminobutyrate hydrolase family protein [Jiangellaceae bacterium]|nr:gamma-glutamyl-gamma-aminobutyrate hydrolase family protein [Jiangellaceae bacterium]